MRASLRGTELRLAISAESAFVHRGLNRLLHTHSQLSGVPDRSSSAAIPVITIEGYKQEVSSIWLLLSEVSGVFLGRHIDHNAIETHFYNRMRYCARSPRDAIADLELLLKAFLVGTLTHVGSASFSSNAST
jgi:hypothetical protein